MPYLVCLVIFQPKICIQICSRFSFSGPIEMISSNKKTNRKGKRVLKRGKKSLCSHESETESSLYMESFSTPVFPCTDPQQGAQMGLVAIAVDLAFTIRNVSDPALQLLRENTSQKITTNHTDTLQPRSPICLGNKQMKFGDRLISRSRATRFALVMG